MCTKCGIGNLPAELKVVARFYPITTYGFCDCADGKRLKLVKPELAQTVNINRQK